MKLRSMSAIALCVVVLAACGGEMETEGTEVSTKTSQIGQDTPIPPAGPPADSSTFLDTSSTATSTLVPVQESPRATPTQEVRGIRISEWVYRFESLEEMERAVDFVVVGEVAAVEHDIPDAYPLLLRHAQVELRIVDDWSRSTVEASSILLEQSAGSPKLYDEDDPPYAVGETYLLFLRRDRGEGETLETRRLPSRRFTA